LERAFSQVLKRQFIRDIVIFSLRRRRLTPKTAPYSMFIGWMRLTELCATPRRRQLIQVPVARGLSRSQTSNIIVGRFGVSLSIVQRVLELSRAA